MQSKGVYVVKTPDGGSTISTAITILQIKAGAAAGLELLRAVLTQKGSTTSAQESVEIVRKTGAATVTSFTPRRLDPGDAVSGAVGSTSGTGNIGTAEGTDGEVLVEDGFNVLNGWLWLPSEQERIWVPAAGIIALKFPGAPASQSWRAALYFREYL